MQEIKDKSTDNNSAVKADSAAGGQKKECGRGMRIASAALILLALAVGAYFAGKTYSYEEKAESMFSGASFVCAEVRNDAV